MKNIDPAELASWLGDKSRAKPVLLDVREGWELEKCMIPGSKHIPMNDVPARVRELDAASETVVICHHGGRSMRVAMFLEQQGFQAVHNLSGGVNSWAETVDPSMPRY